MKRKENPLMVNQKRIKGLSNVGSDDENIIRKFIIIVVVIIILSGIVYAVTELTKKKDTNEGITAGEVNYDIVTIGMLLNRPEKEYYVLIYDENNEDAIIYSALINSYNNKSEHLKLYYCNLANKLNKDYYNVGNDNKSNPKAATITELDLGDLTLIKVKNGKIDSYIENYDSIKNLLK